MEQKELYKVAMYANNIVYRLDNVHSKLSFTLKEIYDMYFNQGKKKSGIFNKDYKNLVVHKNIWKTLYDYHLEHGNKNYCNTIAEFPNKLDITMIYNPMVDSREPWNYDVMLYDMFAEEIPSSSNILFIATNQLNSDKTCSEAEYDIFYKNVCELCDLCAYAIREWEQNNNPKVMGESPEEPLIHVSWPKRISLHISETIVQDITNLDEIKTYMNDIMWDDNIVSGVEAKIDGKDYIVNMKPGAIYIGDPDTGEMEGYIGSYGCFKHKS